MSIFYPLAPQESSKTAEEDFINDLKKESAAIRNATVALVMGLSPIILTQTKCEVEAEHIWNIKYKTQAYKDLDALAKLVIINVNFVYSAAKAVFIKRHILTTSDVTLAIAGWGMDKELSQVNANFICECVCRIASGYKELTGIPEIGLSVYKLAMDTFNEQYHSAVTISPEYLSHVVYTVLRGASWLMDINKPVEANVGFIKELVDIYFGQHIFTSDYRVKGYCGNVEDASYAYVTMGWRYERTDLPANKEDQIEVLEPITDISLENIQDLLAKVGNDNFCRDEYKELAIGLEAINAHILLLDKLYKANDLMVANNATKVALEDFSDTNLNGMLADGYSQESLKEEIVKVIMFIIRNLSKILPILIGILIVVIGKFMHRSNSNSHSMVSPDAFNKAMQTVIQEKKIPITEDPEYIKLINDYADSIDRFFIGYSVESTIDIADNCNDKVHFYSRLFKALYAHTALLKDVERIFSMYIDELDKYTAELLKIENDPLNRIAGGLHIDGTSTEESKQAALSSSKINFSVTETKILSNAHIEIAYSLEPLYKYVEAQGGYTPLAYRDRQYYLSRRKYSLHPMHMVPNDVGVIFYPSGHRISAGLVTGLYLNEIRYNEDFDRLVMLSNLTTTLLTKDNKPFSMQVPRVDKTITQKVDALEPKLKQASRIINISTKPLQDIQTVIQIISASTVDLSKLFDFSTRLRSALLLLNEKQEKVIKYHNNYQKGNSGMV